jgi:phosphoserine phosphatase RsbX
MTTASTNTTATIEWCVVSRPIRGESTSGDLHVVSPWSEGVLLAVVDGLGHGEEATAAARAAVQILERYAGATVDSLVQQCHRAMQQTRGAVMTIVSVNARRNTAAVIGIGNVETMIFRANPEARPRRESVLLRGGVVGYKLPPLRVDTLPIAVGDVIVFATDGVRDDFADGLNTSEPLCQLVEKIIAEKFRGTDDGLVLACKFLGNHEA